MIKPLYTSIFFDSINFKDTIFLYYLDFILGQNTENHMLASQLLLFIDLATELLL